MNDDDFIPFKLRENTHKTEFKEILFEFIVPFVIFLLIVVIIILNIKFSKLQDYNVINKNISSNKYGENQYHIIIKKNNVVKDKPVSVGEYYSTKVGQVNNYDELELP